MSKPPFLPSPRPRPHTSPEEARLLAAATSDLGFTRASSAPQEPPAALGVPETPRPAETIETGPVRTPKIRASARRRTKATVLKVEVPDPVWTALRQEALDRRVTVKYLVLEALAAKGYAFDLSAIPKDGRRLR
ncbi:hypothetical protein ASF41_23265 [Methylobacterium sp. Leaf111]|uniref:hypothetical protein n=1 Tax=Methylobacterium sp. Leaf111 TaxID=1736257 RepID=UPI0006F8A0C6|nr:hypothetical protein [Methylobacterium sp. Leaf111]KQP53646.1 hypothetical protein ASF41_23265 [Methylobacterium sp. Leaf111]